MCYPCTMCNGCGKLDPGSPLYMPMAVVKCLDCGGDVDSMSGKCLNCGKQVMIPLGDDPAEPAVASGAEASTASEPDSDDPLTLVA